jgi:hypothetical protein
MSDDFTRSEQNRERRTQPKKKSKVSFQSLIAEAKKGLKNGPTKNKVWAFVCFGGVLALLIYWFYILGSLG